MKRALDKLKLKPSIIYIDGLFAPKDLKIKYKTFVKGDEENNMYFRSINCC